MGKVANNIIAIVIMSMGTILAPAILISAYAAPTTVLNGAGVADFSCADGIVTNHNIPFQIDAQKGPSKTQTFKLSGSFAIQDGGGELLGNIYGGKIGKSAFSLSAIEQSQNNFCPAEPLPSKGTITGACGQGVQIEFKFENGGHGTGTGNIVCYG